MCVPSARLANVIAKSLMNLNLRALNAVRLEIFASLGLVLLVLSSQSYADDYECPPTMEEILAEQRRATDVLDFKRMRFLTNCRPTTVHEEAFKDDLNGSLVGTPYEARLEAKKESLIADAKSTNDYSLVAKILRDEQKVKDIARASAPQATQLNTLLMTQYQELLIEQNDKFLRQNQRIIELLEAIQRKSIR